MRRKIAVQCNTPNVPTLIAVRDATLPRPKPRIPTHTLEQRQGATFFYLPHQTTTQQHHTTPLHQHRTNTKPTPPQPLHHHHPLSSKAGSTTLKAYSTPSSSIAAAADSTMMSGSNLDNKNTNATVLAVGDMEEDVSPPATRQQRPVKAGLLFALAIIVLYVVLDYTVSA